LPNDEGIAGVRCGYENTSSLPQAKDFGSEAAGVVGTILVKKESDGLRRILCS